MDATDLSLGTTLSSAGQTDSDVVKVCCVVTRRLGLSEYEVEWGFDASHPPFPAATILETWFEPNLHCVQYEMYVKYHVPTPPSASSAPNLQRPSARFIHLVDIHRLPWSVKVHRGLCFTGKYAEGESFDQFNQRTSLPLAERGNPRLISFEKLRWIRWTAYTAIVHMFGELHATPEINRYIQQEGLLEMTDIRDWLRSPAAVRRCPFRIHPEVVREMFGLVDGELADEVAVVEEMKHAMCKYQCPRVKSEQFMRVLNFCKDVSGAVKRLITRNVIRKVTTTGSSDYELSFIDVAGPVVLVTEGEPVWDLVHSGVNWERAAAAAPAPTRPELSAIYTRMDHVTPTIPRQAKRLFMPSVLFGEVSFIPRTIRGMIQATDWCRRVVFLDAYPSSVNRGPRTGLVGVNHWYVVRSRSPPYEYAFMQGTFDQGRPDYTIHGLTKTNETVKYTTLAPLTNKYAMCATFEYEHAPKELLKHCDLVVLFTRRSSPAQAGRYLHTLLESTEVNVLVVGEWGLC